MTVAGIYITVCPEDLPPALAAAYQRLQAERHRRGEPPAETVPFQVNSEVRVEVALDDRFRGRCGTLGPNREIVRRLGRSREQSA